MEKQDGIEYQNSSKREGKTIKKIKYVSLNVNYLHIKQGLTSAKVLKQV